MRAAVALMLVTCACRSAPTAEPQPSAYTAPHLEELIDRARACTAYCNELFLASDLRPIAGKLPIDLRVESITADMLANMSTPTGEEKRAIGALVERHAACHAKETELVGALSGPPSLWYSHQRESHLASLKRLYAGDLTYGSFTASLLEIQKTVERERSGEELARVANAQDPGFSEQRARRAADVQSAYEKFASTTAAPTP